MGGRENEHGESRDSLNRVKVRQKVNEESAGTEDVKEESHC